MEGENCAFVRDAKRDVVDEECWGVKARSGRGVDTNRSAVVWMNDGVMVVVVAVVR